MSAVVEMHYCDCISTWTDVSEAAHLRVDERDGRLWLGDHCLTAGRERRLPTGDLMAALSVMGAEDGLDLVKLNGSPIWSWAAEQAAQEGMGDA